MSPTLAFLIQAVGISLSGVLAPGPMTAATVEHGLRRRHAGLHLAVGHALIELPLMVLILLTVRGVAGAMDLGVQEVLRRTDVRVGIGLVGGLVLLFLGASMLWGLRRATPAAAPGNPPPLRRHPLVTGVALTAANPYFLVWWVTAGLALVTEAARLGLAAFVIFAALHWTLDLLWLEVLSVSSHYGARLLKGRVQTVLLAVCGLAMVGFGGKFLLDAAGAALGAH